jgi:hypothetical protein
MVEEILVKAGSRAMLIQLDVLRSFSKSQWENWDILGKLDASRLDSWGWYLLVRENDSPTNYKLVAISMNSRGRALLDSLEQIIVV